MLGVDKLDQLMAYYSFLHKSVKWWRRVFFWLLEVDVINSYIIFKELCTPLYARQVVSRLTTLTIILAIIANLSLLTNNSKTQTLDSFTLRRH